MKMSAILGIVSPYTRQELYDLWFHFRDEPNAAKMLSDFMGSDTATAKQLIDEFERKLRYEQEGRDY